jgi:hypothetical protein
VPAVLLAWFAALYAGTATRPLWGDEAPIVSTIALFGRGITLDLLRTYPEMNTPLIYVVFAGWGRLVGFELWRLRILAVVLAFVTSWIVYRLLRDTLDDRRVTLVSLATVVLNPYYIGLSAFVFTDMLALLTMALGWWALIRRRFAYVGLAAGAALLTRQYFVFLFPALLSAEALNQQGRRRDLAQLATWLALGAVPFIALVSMWQGLAPPNAKRAIYLQQGLAFDPHALTLYLAVPAVYLLPVVAWRLSRGVRWQSAAAGVLLAAPALAVPIKAAVVQIVLNRGTVGFIHRFLVASLPPSALPLASFAMAAIWITIVVDCGFDLADRWRHERLDVGAWIPWTMFVAFLVVMPFSYMPWEKYAVPMFIAAVPMIASTLVKHPGRLASVKGRRRSLTMSRWVTSSSGRTDQPLRAASMAAMSIFFMGIMASKARFASVPPAASAAVRTRGVICQERPQRSLHQPHALSLPPLPTIAFQ